MLHLENDYAPEFKFPFFTTCIVVLCCFVALLRRVTAIYMYSSVSDCRILRAANLPFSDLGADYTIVSRAWLPFAGNNDH